MTNLEASAWQVKLFEESLFDCAIKCVYFDARASLIPHDESSLEEAHPIIVEIDLADAMRVSVVESPRHTLDLQVDGFWIAVGIRSGDDTAVAG